MNSDFCLYLKFLKELVTGVYNYRSYGDAEANYALGILNRVVKENMGLFTLSSDVFENYKNLNQYQEIYEKAKKYITTKSNIEEIYEDKN